MLYPNVNDYLTYCELEMTNFSKTYLEARLSVLEARLKIARMQFHENDTDENWEHIVYLLSEINTTKNAISNTGESDD